MRPHKEAHCNDFEQHLNGVNDQENEINIVLILGEEAFFSVIAVELDTLVVFDFVEVGIQIPWSIKLKCEVFLLAKDLLVNS